MINLSGGTRTVGFLHLTGDQTRDWNIINGTLRLESLVGSATVDYQSLNPTGSSRISATLQLASDTDFL